MSRATLEEIQAAARRRRGLPDVREREPLAAQGYTLPWGEPARDLVEMLAIDAAVREMEDLGVGVAIPGG
jgi:hypothetical protein